MNSLSRLQLTIIGAGRVGQSIGRLLVKTGLVEVKYVVDLNLEVADQAVDFIGEGLAVDSFLSLQTTSLYFIAVEDAQIQ